MSMAGTDRRYVKPRAVLREKKTPEHRDEDGQHSRRAKKVSPMKAGVHPVAQTFSVATAL